MESANGRWLGLGFRVREPPTLFTYEPTFFARALQENVLLSCVRGGSVVCRSAFKGGVAL